MSQNRLLLSLLCMLGTLSCCTPDIPQAAPNNEDVRLTPDYADVTIPYNIAPLNFRVMEPLEEVRADIYAGQGGHIVLRGRHKNIRIPEKAWRRLLEANRGGVLSMDIYTRQHGVWSKFNTVHDTIADEVMDRWISYRLMETGYTACGAAGLYQRDVESFREQLVYSNVQARENGTSQRIGAHAMQPQGGRWLFQVRDAGAGLMLMEDGRIEKLSLEADTLGGELSAAAFHPELPLAAFSLRHSLQVLHSTLPERTDIIDFASDLVLFDVQEQTLTPITGTPGLFETQPVWSPDGRKLYFCQAACPTWTDTLSVSAQVYTSYKEIRYSLMSMDFDAATRTFGTPDTIYDFAAAGVSAAMPSVSPDGRFMLLSLSRYGCYPALQHISELYLLNLETTEVSPLSQVNARYADSQAGWSSTGRWMVVTSCRDDGQYSRLYLAYFDRDGQAHKPFLLPQKHQMDNVTRLSSYLNPVFMTAPITETARKIQKAVEGIPERNILLSGE